MCCLKVHLKEEVQLHVFVVRLQYVNIFEVKTYILYTVYII